MAGLTHYCPAPACRKFSYHLEAQGARAAGLQCPHCEHVAPQNPHPPGTARRPAASAAPGKRALPAVDGLAGKLQGRDATAAGETPEAAAGETAQAGDGGGKPRRRARAKDGDEAQAGSEGEGEGAGS